MDIAISYIGVRGEVVSLEGWDNAEDSIRILVASSITGDLSAE